MRAGPERTCLGCRQVRPKAALLRLSRGEDGRAQVGATGTGRGAYVCPSEECLGQALSKGRLGHAFKRATEPPADAPATILATARGGVRGPFLGPR